MVTIHWKLVCRILRFACVCGILAAPFSAIAGGDDWRFSVLKLIRNGDSYTLELVATVKIDPPMGCSTLTVHGEYAWLQLLLFQGGKLSREGHRSALAFLEKNRDARTMVRFGVLGEGIFPVEGKPCHFRSRGLTLLNDVYGVAVFSAYKLL